MKGRIGLRITSSVLFVFSLILFLSGCVLQRQSVHTLERYYDEVKLPESHPMSIEKKRRKALGANGSGSGARSGSHRRQGSAEYQMLLSAWEAERQRQWEEARRHKEQMQRFAYAQTVTDLDGICAAVMVFADLDRHGSKAARVLLYPSSWDMQLDNAVSPPTKKPQGAVDEDEEEEAEKKKPRKTSRWGRITATRKERLARAGENAIPQKMLELDPPPLARSPAAAAHPHFNTARRLLHVAKVRYGVTLVPLLEGAVEPLTLFNMTEYDRFLYLAHPAQVLRDMDELLAHAPPAVLAAPRSAGGGGGLSPNFLLITPSAVEFKHLSRASGKDEAVPKRPQQLAELLWGEYADRAMLMPRWPFEVVVSELFQWGLKGHSHGAPPLSSSPWSDRVLDGVYYLSFDGRKKVKDNDAGIGNVGGVKEKERWVSVPQPWKVASLDENVAPRCVDVSEGDGAGHRRDCEGRDLWKRAYGGYRQRRMEVCGLDLEV
ncbi:hypothetical protein DRE_02668 [Drechslerella stenobrocha 248]|uniref:Glycosyltransferase family 8 protein n=1 Tax=Drechslerella stenobrocha 248 TaxID=1043628 RepID=W7HX27_9PEZI|nr:hypothetical protein DRE_02668 [Drechslerella stenobrocha 248]